MLKADKPNPGITIPNGPIIELKNVTVRYQTHLAIANVNLTVKKGEYLGLVGPNGSGKTTLLKTILGLLSPNSGEVKVFGKTPSKETKFEIGYIPQLSLIKREFPVVAKQVVEMGLYGKIGLFKAVVEDDRQKVQRALHLVHMEDYSERPIGHLSGGEQQKIMIARALVTEPQLLLLDEPTSALDFRATKSVLELLQELNHERGIALVVIHHNLEMLRPYCSRLAVINKTILWEGQPNDPQADAAITRAYQL